MRESCMQKLPKLGIPYVAFIGNVALSCEAYYFMKLFTPDIAIAAAKCHGKWPSYVENLVPDDYYASKTIIGLFCSTQALSRMGASSHWIIFVFQYY